MEVFGKINLRKEPDRFQLSFSLGDHFPVRFLPAVPFHVHLQIRVSMLRISQHPVAREQRQLLKQELAALS